MDFNLYKLILNNVFKPKPKFKIGDFVITDDGDSGFINFVQYWDDLRTYYYHMCHRTKTGICMRGVLENELNSYINIERSSKYEAI